jgi:hypothetical protein
MVKTRFGDVEPIDNTDRKCDYCKRSLSLWSIKTGKRIEILCSGCITKIYGKSTGKK